MIGRGEWKKGSDWEKEERGKETTEWGEAKERPQSRSPGHSAPLDDTSVPLGKTFKRLSQLHIHHDFSLVQNW